MVIQRYKSKNRKTYYRVVNMLQSKKYNIITVVLFLFLAACANSHADLEVGKEARRAGEYDMAVHHLQPLADLGIDEAKYELAMVYLRKKDSTSGELNTARNLLQEVKGRREPNALFERGRLYAKGLGVKKDVEKAKNFYQTSGDKGYPRAYYELADILTKQGHYDKASKLCQKAYDAQYYRAAMCLGKLEEKGLGTSQNLKKALAWYMVAERENVKRSGEKVKDLSSRLNSGEVKDAAKISMEL